MDSYTKELKKYFHKDLVEFIARQWVLLVTIGRGWKNLLKERYIEVFYENLTKNPLDILRKVCKTIEINPDLIKIDIEITNPNYKYQETDFKANTYTMKRAIQKQDISKLTIIKNLMEELNYPFDISTNSY